MDLYDNICLINLIITILLFTLLVNIKKMSENKQKDCKCFTITVEGPDGSPLESDVMTMVFGISVQIHKIVGEATILSGNMRKVILLYFL